MIIQKIDVYHNDLSRVILYFEDRTFLTVDAAEAKKIGLKEGMDLTDAMRQSLLTRSQKNIARATAARIVGHNSMSCATLLKKLQDKGIMEEDAQDALSWLIHLGIMNDQEYGQTLVQYYRNRGFGNRRIYEELRKRGISREDIDVLLCDEVDMQNEIQAFIKKRAHGQRIDQSLQIKITNALIRRGHSYEAIRSAFRHIDEDTECLYE